MSCSTLTRLDRRTLLKAAAMSAALLASTSLTRLAFAGTAEPVPFDFERLTERMRLSAALPYSIGDPPLPEVFATLKYDGYLRIQFDPERAKWSDSGTAYRVLGFPMGWLFKHPVGVFEVAGGEAHAFDFGTDDFSFHDADIGARAHTEPFPGVSGIKINYPINLGDKADELVSFLGASYFRALGRNNVYGLSARGLVIDSWREGPEEFPRFSEFYLERPNGDGPLVMHAALEGPSVAGAYRMVLTPAGEAQETMIEVTARLFFRSDIVEIGIAPLTSMFLFAESNRAGFDDYRPQVHDSNGLLLERENGEVMWRALNNTQTLGNTYLWDSKPRAFGLYQRDREFETYQDAGAHYERRPSVRVEPIDGFGQGSVRLIEAPAKLEADDNIGVFWVPDEPIRAGEAREFRYRLIWGDLPPKADDPLACVAETRAGQGGVSGVENAATLRKFVIDFRGGELAVLEADAVLEVKAEASAGKITTTTLSKVAENGAWRLVLDVETEGEPLIELRASVASNGHPLSETWLYQWRAA